MNGVEFEKFYIKYNLKIDLFDYDYNTGDINLLYKSVPVCKYFKNSITGERYIRFPGKVWPVDDFDKACDWFEKHCIIKTKEIDVFHKLKEMKKDFE